MLKTESAGGIILHNGKIIIVNQRGDSWSLPKGHVEPGENLIEAAIREIYEETGLKNIKYVREFAKYQRYRIGIDGHDDISELKTIHMFLFETNDNDIKSIDPDITEVRWVDKKEAPGFLTHPKDKEFLSTIINDL